jgi:hypothetical protein
LKAAQGIKIIAHVLGFADEVSLCQTVDSLFRVLQRDFGLHMLTFMDITIICLMNYRKMSYVQRASLDQNVEVHMVFYVTMVTTLMTLLSVTWVIESFILFEPYAKLHYTVYGI